MVGKKSPLDWPRLRHAKATVMTPLQDLCLPGKLYPLAPKRDKENVENENLA